MRLQRGPRRIEMVDAWTQTSDRGSEAEDDKKKKESKDSKDSKDTKDSTKTTDTKQQPKEGREDKVQEGTPLAADSLGGDSMKRPNKTPEAKHQPGSYEEHREQLKSSHSDKEDKRSAFNSSLRKYTKDPKDESFRSLAGDPKSQHAKRLEQHSSLRGGNRLSEISRKNAVDTSPVKLPTGSTLRGISGSKDTSGFSSYLGK